MTPEVRVGRVKCEVAQLRKPNIPEDSESILNIGILATRDRGNARA